jgi:hypothetical protein
MGSNAPRFAPNSNTGKPLPDGDEKRVATNTIHMSAEHPSAVVLTVCAVATDAPQQGSAQK